MRIWPPDTYYAFFFFFNDTATTEIYTLSLHDALPISYSVFGREPITPDARRASFTACQRSEEHTSELQSQSNLVCRLLLEKKNIYLRNTQDIVAEEVNQAHALIKSAAVRVAQAHPSLR